MNNKYFLLRHGQTIYQAEKRGVLYSSPEIPPVELTEKGKGQIQKAAKALENRRIDLIFSSDFYRTRQTAGIVAKELRLEINFDVRLRDLNLGEFHGRLKQDYQKFFLEKRERFSNRPLGGESWNDVIKRLNSFLKEIESEYQNKNILIISHGDPLWLLVGILKGFKTEQEFLKTRGTNLYPDVGQLIKI